MRRSSANSQPAPLLAVGSQVRWPFVPAELTPRLALEAGSSKDSPQISCVEMPPTSYGFAVYPQLKPAVCK